MNENLLVSVVIIGRNEGARLVRCLESVKRATAKLDAVEILYVDSASTDDSIACATALGARALPLRHAAPSAARARNLGWRKARGSFILFLDGDTVLQPEFLQAALDAMADPTVAVVWGHRRELDPQQSVYVRVLDLDWIYPAGDSLFCGGDALMRRSALEACGGFDASLIAGEEPELCSRLRARQGRIVHLDVSMTLHDLAVRSLAAYWRRAFRAGHAYAEVAYRCSVSGDGLWQRDARRNLVHGAGLLSAPLWLAGAWMLSPIAALALGALGLGLLLRTVHQCRWKSPDLGTRVLYAVHSHFQQIPILFGQLAFHRARLQGRRQDLIEYKGK